MPRNVAIALLETAGGSVVFDSHDLTFYRGDVEIIIEKMQDPFQLRFRLEPR